MVILTPKTVVKTQVLSDSLARSSFFNGVDCTELIKTVSISFKKDFFHNFSCLIKIDLFND